MKWHTRLGAITLVLVFAVLAHAAGTTQQVWGNRFSQNPACFNYSICIAEADTGPCQDASGTNTLVAMLQGRWKLTFDSTSSTASAWVCDMFTRADGYDDTDRQQINTTSLTETSKVISFDGPLLTAWVECGTITGGAVNVELTACSE